MTLPPGFDSPVQPGASMTLTHWEWRRIVEGLRLLHQVVTAEREADEINDLRRRVEARVSATTSRPAPEWREPSALPVTPALLAGLSCTHVTEPEAVGPCDGPVDRAVMLSGAEGGTRVNPVCRGHADQARALAMARAQAAGLILAVELVTFDERPALSTSTTIDDAPPNAAGFVLDDGSVAYYGLDDPQGGDEGRT